MSLDSRKGNAPLRYSGAASREAKEAIADWIDEIEGQPDIVGVTTYDRVMIAVVNKLCREDLAEAYSQFVERKRLWRLDADRREVEKAVGAERLAAEKAERDAAKAERAAAKQAHDDAVIAAYVERLRKEEEAKPPVRRDLYWPPSLV